MRICVIPDSGNSAGIGSWQTDKMCDMRRSVRDLDDLAAIILYTILYRKTLAQQKEGYSLSQIEPAFYDSIDVLPAHVDRPGIPTRSFEDTSCTVSLLLVPRASLGRAMTKPVVRSDAKLAVQGLQVPYKGMQVVYLRIMDRKAMAVWTRGESHSFPMCREKGLPENTRTNNRTCAYVRFTCSKAVQRWARQATFIGD